MRNKKAVITGALIAPVLALTSGIAYASTSSGTAPAVTRPAVTTTLQAHTTTQPHHGSYCGNRCDWRGHGYQRQPTQQRAQRHATQHRSYRGGYGSQRSGYQHHGHRGSRDYRGGYGYQGGWSYRGGGSGQGGCCHGGW